MDWLGAQAIHRSSLRTDRLTAEGDSKKLHLEVELAEKKADIENEIEERRSKRLDLEAASLKKKDEIESEVIEQAIERRKN